MPAVDAAATPLEPAATAIEQSQAYIEAAISSGDPARLRDFLVGEARCGEWIPVVPGEPDGATIADAVALLG